MSGARRNLKLVIEYDGTAYSGWQLQKNSVTVQEVLERCLAHMTRESCRLCASGRTDAGVHARGQVANFFTTSNIPCDAFVRGLNAALPKDVSVLSVEEVSADFNARRAARGKHYIYRVFNRRIRSPHHERTTWQIYAPLDVAAMQAAARQLLGEHDFSAFRAKNCVAKNPVRVLRRLDVTHETEHLLRIDLEGTAFLKNMARVLVGTLVEVGLGARPADSMADLLTSRDRTRAGVTAPARGLTLERVHY